MDAYFFRGITKSMNFNRAFFAFLLVIALTTMSITSFATFNSKAVRQVQEAADLTGKWNATLDVGGGVMLRLVLKLTKASDGSYNAVVNSLDQSGDMDLAVDTVDLKDSTFRFEMKAIHAVYEGTVSSDGTEIIGRWTQSVGAILIFRRDELKGKPAKTFKRGSVTLEPCNLPKLTKEARCGKYEVFEDRSAARGRKIALNILILPASGENVQPDPLFFLAGGPGQGAVKVVTEAGDFLSGVRRERDIVFIDQRGTGESNPLNCNLIKDRNDMRSYFAVPSQVDAVRQCRNELEKIANLALYTTSIAMDDLDELRGALGYEDINLYGGSYGTNAALVYIRQHGDHVRSAVLKGVAPTDYKMPLYFAKGVQNATDRVFEDCAADEKCSKTFPKLKSEFADVLARLDKGPITVDVVNLVTNKPQQVSMSRASFAESLRILLYVPELTSMLPLIIHQAYEGDFAPFAAYAFVLIRQIEPQLASGMGFSVTCSEHVPFITEADITREVTGTYYGEAKVRGAQKTCQEWPSIKAPSSFINPVKSDLPILLISGDIDPVTPSWVAAGAAKLMPNALHVRIHDGTHLTESPCISNMIAKFVSNGSTKGLDASCVNEIKRPSFVYEFPISFKPAGK